MNRCLLGKNWTRIGTLAALATLAIGCDEDGGKGEGPAEGALTVTGAVVGAAIPSQANAVVVWVVSSGSPDYSYKFGGGSSNSASFQVALAAEPPAEAVNSYGVGLGFIVLLDTNQQIPDGIVDEKQLRPLLGVSARHALIWKSKSGPGLSWSGAFPAGYACGKCAPPPAGSTFESFEPADCSQFEVETAVDIDTIDSCNWT